MQELEKYIDKDYQHFCKKIAPTAHKVLGIKMPYLHTYSRSIQESEYPQWLEKIPSHIQSAEEGIILSDILGKALKTIPLQTWWKYTCDFLLWCDCWNYIDNLFSQLKWLQTPKYSMIYTSLYPLLLPSLSSTHPYTLRFVILMLARYYPQSHERLFERFADFSNEDEHYLKMGIAWALSEMFCKDEEKIYAFLSQKTLCPWIFSQTLSKIIQSKQITQESKEKIKKLKERK